MFKGRGHGTRLSRVSGQFAARSCQKSVVVQDTNTAPNHGRGGKYKSRGSFVRRGVATGRGHGPTQPWRAPGSNLVTSIGGGTNPHMSGFQGQRDQSQVAMIYLKLLKNQLGQLVKTFRGSEEFSDFAKPMSLDDGNAWNQQGNNDNAILT